MLPLSLLQRFRFSCSPLNFHSDVGAKGVSVGLKRLREQGLRSRSGEGAQLQMLRKDPLQGFVIRANHRRRVQVRDTKLGIK